MHGRTDRALRPLSSVRAVMGVASATLYRTSLIVPGSSSRYQWKLRRRRLGRGREPRALPGRRWARDSRPRMPLACGGLLASCRLTPSLLQWG